MSHNDVTDRQERYARFVELLQPLRQKLYGFARALTADHDDACDLVGETIAAGLHGYDPSHPPGAFMGYLCTIAVRLQRRKRKRAALFVRMDETFDTASGAAPPDLSADVGALLLALARLPAAQREAVALFELTGLSLKEIRDIQGGTLSGVKSRVARGRERLARELGARDGEWNERRATSAETPRHTQRTDAVPVTAADLPHLSTIA